MNNAKSETLAKYKAIMNEWSAVRASQERNRIRIEELKLAALDCEAAARLFGFDLGKEFHTQNSSQSIMIQKNIPLPRTVREFVIDEAKKAFPNPVTAAELRLKLEAERGEKVHEKTIGMTNYRLSKDGVLRREKYNWFFVPEDSRGVFG